MEFVEHHDLEIHHLARRSEDRTVEVDRL